MSRKTEQKIESWYPYLPGREKIGHSEDPFNVYKKKLIHKWKIEQFFPISDDRGGFASEDIEYQKDGKWILCESNVVIDSLDKLPCRLRQDYPE